MLQVLALIGLRAGKKIVQQNLAIIEANVAHFEAFCKRHSNVMAVNAPAAGSVAFARLLTGEPIEAFCVRLVDKAGEEHLLYYLSSCIAALPVRKMSFSELQRWSPLLLPSCGMHTAGVLLLPATVYNHTPSIADARFRVGLGRRNMPECLRVLEDFLEKDRQYAC